MTITPAGPSTTSSAHIWSRSSKTRSTDHLQFGVRYNSDKKSAPSKDSRIVIPGQLMPIARRFLSWKTPCALSLLLCALPLLAQTVRIDTAKPSNAINPRDSVGAGVDRIPVEAIDRDLTKQALQPVLDVRMATRHLPPEHGPRRGSLALEPGRHVERSRPERAISPVPLHPPASFATPSVTHCRIAASPVTTAPGTSASPASRMETRAPTGRAIPTSPAAILAKTTHFIHNG